MTQLTRSKIILRILLVMLLTSSALVAEAKTITVESNDTLSRLVITHYPEGTPLVATMEAILAKNPAAFVNNDINRLIVGKTLELPDTGSLPQQEQSDSGATLSGSTVLLERITSLEALRQSLTQQLEALEADNQRLREQVKAFEAAKQERDRELESLEAEIQRLKDEAEAKSVTLPNSSEEVAELQTALSGLKEENDSLQRQLEEITQRLAERDEENADLARQLASVKDEQSLLQQEHERNVQSIQDELDSANTAKSTMQESLQSSQAELEQLQVDKALLEEKALAQSQQEQSLWKWLVWGLGLLLLPLFLLWLFLRGRRDRADQSEPAVAQPVQPPEPDVFAEPIPFASLDHIDEPVVATAPSAVTEPIESDNEAQIKLNIARAYMDFRDSDAAYEMLQEVLREGNEQQKQEAREILSFIS